MCTKNHSFNFLLSSERSGSNLLCKILDAHPEISSPSPLHALRFFIPYLKESCSFTEQDFKLFFQYKLGFWNLQAEQLPSSENKLNFWCTWEEVYKAEADLEGKTSSFIKENRFYEIADTVLERYPNAKFIYLVRNPFSYAASFIKSHNHHGDLQHAITVWTEDQLQFLKLEELLGDRCLRITYESLLTETEKTLKKISNHLKVKYTDNMMQFHLKAINQQNALRISNWENIAKPLISLSKTIQVPLSQASFNYIYNVASVLINTLYGESLAIDYKGEEVTKRNLSPEETLIREERSKVIEAIKNGLNVRKH